MVNNMYIANCRIYSLIWLVTPELREVQDSSRIYVTTLHGCPALHPSMACFTICE